MKTSEEILLDEVRGEYTRLLSTWAELNQKAQNFLQLNGVLLSLIFVGTGILINSPNDIVFIISIILMVSSGFIIVSILILVKYVISAKGIKEISINIKGKANLENQEKAILQGLIIKYNNAQEDIISKHGERLKYFALSTQILLIGLHGLLLALIVMGLSIVV